MKYWKTSRRKIPLDRPLVMGVLNVTPDSFSDGGKFDSVETARRRAEQMIAEGADIIDLGGESTRPGSKRVPVNEEISRVVPAIKAIKDKFDTPLSIDTTKSEVAEAAVDAGAEIINDISGLRFDERIGDIAVARGTGLVLMQSLGEFETMHSQPPADHIIDEVLNDFRRSTALAEKAGVKPEQIVLDVGIGFGKTLEQNLELIAKLDKLVSEFENFPLLVGTSRKSFIGKLLGGAGTEGRLGGSLATGIIAVMNGARILRVHDIRETVQALSIVGAIRHGI
ncbi:MAG TPA: dihydropteroate synthase [Pyrinomonadaceae bacterium]|nr:dihydropteroate synthase [Pyrinomonadaceae bacterium]